MSKRIPAIKHRDREWHDEDLPEWSRDQKLIVVAVAFACVGAGFGLWFWMIL